MYFEDLSNSVNNKGEIEENVLMVGWLDEKHDFKKGSIAETTLEKILSLCFTPTKQTRGFHQSPFLNPSPIGYPVEYKGKQMRLGSAEIMVKSTAGIVYRAPNLIYHYIKDCNYLPPQEFIDAVDSIDLKV